MFAFADKSQQGLLATYLIPGCVGRGIRLGSESLSGAGPGGVWKSGNLEIWRSGILEICEFGIKKIQKLEFSKSNSVSPKMSTRSGLVGKNPPGPISCHFKHFLCGSEKSGKKRNFAYFPWWVNGPCSPFKETRAHCNVCWIKLQQLN